MNVQFKWDVCLPNTFIRRLNWFCFSKYFDLGNVIALSNCVIANYPEQNINFNSRQFVLALYCFYQFVQKQKVFSHENVWGQNFVALMCSKLPWKTNKTTQTYSMSSVVAAAFSIHCCREINVFPWYKVITECKVKHLSIWKVIAVIGSKTYFLGYKHSMINLV